ncbi:hypothetical protein [Rhodopirellula europaea]|uniref:hypothetical protein n=1 Tax=Rhodopirellula europaea TaxID=1263866 RepID=UPI003D2A900B
MIKDDAEALALFREAMVERPGKRAKPGADIADNVSNKEKVDSGNSRAYSIDRVRRECDEETVQQVMSGDLSPNATLVKAGIRDNRQVYMPHDPVKAAAKIRQQLGAAMVEAINAS